MTDPTHQPGPSPTQFPAPSAQPAPQGPPLTAGSPPQVRPVKTPRKPRTVLVGAISGVAGLLLGIGIGAAGGGDEDTEKLVGGASTGATTSSTDGAP